MAKTVNFEEIYNAARTAGLIAGNAANPAPMIVRDADVLTGQPLADGRKYIVADGVCGFAWVHVKGNTAFGRWARKAGHARSSYHGGLDISVRDFGQSMQRKQAYASAFAKVLRENGITDAYSDSRMD
jgi:hypothetical protein